MPAAILQAAAIPAALSYILYTEYGALSRNLWFDAAWRDLILDCAKVNDHAQSIFLSIWTQKEGENVTRQFKTVEFEDRKTIAAMYAAGAVAEEIAQKIGVSRSTVYTELKRGQDGVTLDKNFRPAYDPALAQKRVQEALRRRGRKKGP